MGQKTLIKRILLLTGAPGIGKTTVLIKTVGALKAKGIRVGGMASCEARDGTVRVGFEIIDLASGRQGWLAHINQKSGPQVGKYHVNIDDLNDIGAKAITQAIEKSDVIAIDEIGPMELYSQQFKTTVKQAVESKKPLLAVIHAKAQDTLILQTKQRTDSEVFNVTIANRETLPQELIKAIIGN
jgi:nucleoside-triphosphatase